jgi:hypothetical protein
MSDETKAKLISELAQLLEALRTGELDHFDVGDWLEDNGSRVLAALKAE